MPKAMTRREVAERVRFVGALRRNPLTGELYAPYAGPTAKCGCGVRVPADRVLCHFCTRSERLFRE